MRRSEPLPLLVGPMADARASRWGIETKRQQVHLSTPRPSGVSVYVDDHSFAEVVNQFATRERLLDAAAWAEHALLERANQLEHPFGLLELGHVSCFRHELEASFRECASECPAVLDVEDAVTLAPDHERGHGGSA